MCKGGRRAPASGPTARRRLYSGFGPDLRLAALWQLCPEKRPNFSRTSPLGHRRGGLLRTPPASSLAGLPRRQEVVERAPPAAPRAPPRRAEAVGRGVNSGCKVYLASEAAFKPRIFASGNLASARRLPIDAAALARLAAAALRVGAVVQAARVARLPERVGVREEGEHQEVPPRVEDPPEDQLEDARGDLDLRGAEGEGGGAFGEQGRLRRGAAEGRASYMGALALPSASPWIKPPSRPRMRRAAARR